MQNTNEGLTQKQINEKGLSIQTDKFIFKMAKKKNNWYVALFEKDTTKMLIKNFGTKRHKADKYYFGMIGQ